MSQSRRRRSPLLVGTATAVAAAAALVVGVHGAQAAAGCRVDYAVTSQWQGGFGAAVTVTNLGDAVNGWRLTWTFTAGQTVTQAWNTTVTQSGGAVTAANASYNASIATGASVAFGFNGSWTGSNPVPASFALNGTTCTGGVSSSSQPSSSASSSASSSSSSSSSSSGATAFVYATFKGDAAADEELWIYQSTNGGTSYSVLADTNFRGPTGVLRDPSIIRYNGTYYIAYTVQSWTTNSTYFNIASSTNLTSWTNIASVNSGIANTAYTWAPEFYVEGSTVRIITNVAASTCSSCFQPYVYTAQNTALTSWSGPTPMSGLGANHIDAFVVKSGSTWHAFVKNETTKYVEHWTTTSSLTTGWSNRGTLWTSGYEGPSLVRLSDGTWRIYVDKYTNGGIWTATSADLNSWTGLSAVTCSGCRHGTAIPR